MKLNVKAFALACGLLWAFALFVMTWWLIIADGATGDKIFIGRFYIGYNVSPLGSFIGIIWAFLDAGIGGAIFAWLYNNLECLFTCMCKPKTDN